MEQVLNLRDKLLKESGFVDIEERDGTLKDPRISRPPKDLAAVDLMDRRPNWEEHVRATARAEYFRLANQALHEHHFPTPLHRQVWKLHAEGMTFRGIAAQLGISKMQVQYRIGRLQYKFFGSLGRFYNR